MLVRQAEWAPHVPPGSAAGGVNAPRPQQHCARTQSKVQFPAVHGPS